MTRLILLRHGESEANRAGLFAGWSDYPLTPLGHAQAESAAKYIAENYHIACAYTSDLLRASQTGEHVSTRFGLPLVREKACGRSMRENGKARALMRCAQTMERHTAPSVRTSGMHIVRAASPLRNCRRVWLQRYNV